MSYVNQLRLAINLILLILSGYTRCSCSWCFLNAYIGHDVPYQIFFDLRFCVFHELIIQRRMNNANLNF